MTDPVLPQVGLVATPPFLSPLQENAAITRVVVEAIGVLSLETPCTLEKGRLRAGPMGEVVSVELIRELFYYAQRALPPNTRFIVETEKSVKTKTAGAIAEGRGICLSAKEVYTELNDPVAIRWGPLAFELENTLLSQIIHEGPFSRSAMLGDYRDYNSPPPYTKQEKASILEIDFQFLERKDLLFPLDWIGEFFRAFNFPLTLTEILDHSQREKYLLFYVYADYFGFTDLTNTLKTKIESSIYTREVGIIANAQQFRDTLEYLGTYSEPLAYSFFSTLEKGFQDRLFLVDAEDIHTTMRLGYPPRPDTPDSETFYLERGILYRGETPLFDLYTALDRNAQGKENSYFRVMMNSEDVQINVVLILRAFFADLKFTAEFRIGIELDYWVKRRALSPTTQVSMIYVMLLKVVYILRPSHMTLLQEATHGYEIVTLCFKPTVRMRPNNRTHLLGF
jgi:hypothetical protein